MPSSEKYNGVFHILSDHAGWLHEILQPEFPAISELIALGAVYHLGHRVQEPTQVEIGDYIRVHSIPRRYYLGKHDWILRVVHEHEDFVVFNKPAGIPVHAMVDNNVENALTALSQALGYPLWVTHRLDTPTSGIVLVARNPRFQAWFNTQLAKRRVTKTYLGLCAKPAVAGKWVHYHIESSHAPKTLVAYPAEGAVLCETDVLGSEPVGSRWQIRMRPRTGRTHQLRTQAAFEKNPLFGDVLYGGEPGEEGVIGLHACELRFSHRLIEHGFEIPPPWAIPNAAAELRLET